MTRVQAANVLYVLASDYRSDSVIKDLAPDATERIASALNLAIAVLREPLRSGIVDHITGKHCPACGGLRTYQCVEWSATSLEPTDPNHTDIVEEWQCRDCDGLSFWIGADAEMPE